MKPTLVLRPGDTFTIEGEFAKEGLWSRLGRAIGLVKEPRRLQEYVVTKVEPPDSLS